MIDRFSLDPVSRCACLVRRCTTFCLVGFVDLGGDLLGFDNMHVLSKWPESDLEINLVPVFVYLLQCQYIAISGSKETQDTHMFDPTEYDLLKG
jgi:hypothetical protein